MHAKSLLIFTALFASASLPAAEVYTWKNSKGGNSYSDAPRNLRPAHSSTVNIRTHSVTRPAAPETAAAPADDASLAEQQQQLNSKISAENKKIEEQNRKIEEQNRKQKEENCQAARLNRQAAETARNNRSELINRFDSDIGKYCS